jgi:hypothetical protein
MEPLMRKEMVMVDQKIVIVETTPALREDILHKAGWILQDSGRDTLDVSYIRSMSWIKWALAALHNQGVTDEEIEAACRIYQFLMATTDHCNWELASEMLRQWEIDQILELE